MYLNISLCTTQRLRSVPNGIFLWIIEKRRKIRLSRKTSIWFRSDWLKILLGQHYSPPAEVRTSQCTDAVGAGFHQPVSRRFAQPDDVIASLQMLELLRRDGEETIIYAQLELGNELIEKYPENKLRVDASKLHWTPFYIMDPKKDKWSLLFLKLNNPSAGTAGALNSSDYLFSGTALTSG